MTLYKYIFMWYHYGTKCRVSASTHNYVLCYADCRCTQAKIINIVNIAIFCRLSKPPLSALCFSFSNFKTCILAISALSSTAACRSKSSSQIKCYYYKNKHNYCYIQINSKQWKRLGNLILFFLDFNNFSDCIYQVFKAN